MRNKPSTSFVFNWVTSVLVDMKLNAEEASLENFILTLSKLDIASDFYEDYGCDDQCDWARLLVKKADLFLANKYFTQVILGARRKKKLFTADRQTQSHQLVQVLKLVQETCKYLCPSVFLIDSS